MSTEMRNSMSASEREMHKLVVDGATIEYADSGGGGE